MIREKYGFIYIGIAIASLMNISFVLAHDDPLHVPTASRSAQQMTDTARTFIESLSDDQHRALIYDFVDDSERTNWTNAPVDSKKRNGLPIGRLNLKQRTLFHKLLIASTSSQGYQKIWGAVRGDDELKREGEGRELISEKFFNKNRTLGASDFWLSFYGDPRTDINWGYMFTGHHLAANFTVIDGKASFTPLFYGSDPAVIAIGPHAGHVFLSQERNRGYELLASLTDQQRAIAVISDTVPFNKYGAIDFAGPGKKDVTRKPRGITGSALTAEQQKLLWVLIEEYVRNADFDVADTQLAKIATDGIGALYFMWMGPTDGTEKVFFRVQGPSILIDFVDQRTRFDWNTHPHTIVRDPSNDYGQDWLQRHISEEH